MASLFSLKGIKIFFEKREEYLPSLSSSSSSDISGKVSRSKPSELDLVDLLGEADSGANPSSLLGEQLAKILSMDSSSFRDFFLAWTSARGWEE